MKKLWLTSLKATVKSHRNIMVALAATAILILPFPHTDSKTITIPFALQHIQDSSIELGDSQTRQPGDNGQGLEKQEVLKPIFAYLLGLKASYKTSQLPTQTTQAPINQIIADGTKKYQYMSCSDGSYRYFTNDQFKNPNVGFTHKSPDACAQTQHGHMTGLADSAPQETVRNVYTPVYTPSYYSPTLYNPTHCYTQYNTYGGYFDPTANTTCY